MYCHIECVLYTLTGDNTESPTPNYGYQVLVKCAPQVIQGLSRQPAAAATLLLSRGLVSKDLVEEIVDLPQTKSQNGRKLYMTVLDVVKSFPNRYSDFISVLEEDKSLNSDLLSALKDAYHVAGMYKECYLFKNVNICSIIFFKDPNDQMLETSVVEETPADAGE